MNIVNYNLKKKNNEILNKMKIQVIAKWNENCYYSNLRGNAGGDDTTSMWVRTAVDCFVNKFEL